MNAQDVEKAVATIPTTVVASMVYVGEPTKFTLRDTAKNFIPGEYVIRRNQYIVAVASTDYARCKSGDLPLFGHDKSQKLKLYHSLLVSLNPAIPQIGDDSKQMVRCGDATYDVIEGSKIVSQFAVDLLQERHTELETLIGGVHKSSQLHFSDLNQTTLARMYSYALTTQQYTECGEISAALRLPNK